MNRETAERALARLDECGWRGGDSPYVESKECLGEALGWAMHYATGWYSSGEFREARAVIEQLFPGRVTPGSAPGRAVVDFNDHPETIEDDVRLVLNHMVTP